MLSSKLAEANPIVGGLLISKHGYKLHLAFCKAMTIVDFKAGDVVCRYGEPGDCSFVILQGQVTVLVPFRVSGFRPIKKLNLDFELDLLRDDRRLNTSEELTRSQSQVLSSKVTSDFREVSTLTIGDSFGELSLLTNKPRAATILAQTDLSLAKLTKQDFARILQKVEAEKLDNKINFLRSITVFQNWTRESLQKLTYFLKSAKFKQGALLYKEDTPSNEVFIVKEGEFKFYKQLRQESSNSPSRLTHRRRSSASFKLHTELKGKGEIFGIDDVIEGRTRQMTCECSSPTGTLYIISKRDFIDLIQKSDSWDYLVKAHDQSEAWRELKLERLNRAEAVIKRIDEVKPFRSRSQGELPSPERKRVFNSKTPKVRQHSNLQDICSNFSAAASPLSKPDVRSRALTSRAASSCTAATGDRTLMRSIKDLHARKASFEWRNTPVPRSKAYEPRASKPPPTFFASGKHAISKRYQHSPKITGIRSTPTNKQRQHTKQRMLALKAKLEGATKSKFA